MLIGDIVNELNDRCDLIDERLERLNAMLDGCRADLREPFRSDSEGLKQAA